MKNRVFTHGVWLIASPGVSLVLTLIAPGPIRAQAPTCTQVVESFATFTSCTGTLPDPTYAPGRPYILNVPTYWNGTLLLYGQGYIYPASSPPAADEEPTGETSAPSWIIAGDPFKEWLLHNGYAFAEVLAGTGWCVEGALRYGIQTLDMFTSVFGAPARTIAYGGSLGGIISAGLIQQHPERFAGAMCGAGILAGGVGTWNETLDFAFVVQQLLDPGLQIVHIANPSGNLNRALLALDGAQTNPRGRARTALACAVLDLPGWFDPQAPEPAPDDYATREYSQYLDARYIIAPLVFALGRVDVERRAHGNPSWNTGVNYKAQLERSVNYAEVVALYQAAGLSLDDDLARLKAAPRITALPAAVAYLSQNISFNGELSDVPVLTVHNTDDPLITNQHEFAYRSAVLGARDPQELRQAFVHRAGHGLMTTGELVAAFQALIHRIDIGMWGGSASPEALNAAALALGPSFNVLDFGGGYLVSTAPAYIDFDPAPFLRPYNLFSYDPDDGEPLVIRGPGDLEPGLDDPVTGSPLMGQPLGSQGVMRAADPLGRAAPIATPSANGNPRVATRPLAAWPLPYRGGWLQVSFSPGAGMGTNPEVAIYDLSGRRVRLLSGAARGAARSLVWDGRDANGLAVGNGIYFLRAIGAGRSARLKFVVIR